MSNKHYEKMKTLMRRAGSSQPDIKRAYDNYREGRPGQAQQPIHRQGEDRDTDEEEAQSAYDSSLNPSTRESHKEHKREGQGQVHLKQCRLDSGIS
eukprot:4110939-Amphidinium_carterae.1